MRPPPRPGKAICLYCEQEFSQKLWHQVYCCKEHGKLYREARRLLGVKLVKAADPEPVSSQ